ncbi:hypothetical protein CAOG_01937 [Capsaspora owczarzaki ATCC 30864]|uniref:Transcription and mRNA export factor ENY2 n=1 Tax=Capsaspora owczarzaki (strain ATCC 30864) TaxID=595528 RepID=A0A0D2U6A8_CAPO3|nr:hypothetical protein CAOG_01937 [Capsaspora owczarzaki ATCC 30864]KJE90666.1 hypothetical protein CAOG_001937 [Capsaspora owczarzaki ATCC 30864]|eukprot:XP_004364805.1 hypothetical protein CAOG_01937 [Capsaspora owczarzaki ATCC 30864]
MLRSSTNAQPAAAAAAGSAVGAGGQSKEDQLRSRIQQAFIESGEAKRIEELLRARLIDCGWRDNVKAQCKAWIQHVGVEAATVDRLVEEIFPEARGAVPDVIQIELLTQIRDFVSKNT